jgi:cyclin-dependent kinase-like
VNLLEVFRVEGKLYLVFEFVEKTILEEIEKYPEGLDPEQMKRLMWQIVRVVHFLHSNNIIHRDIKPENLLVSRNGVLKICDFGFARPLASAGAKYTEYVSTRWYRAPELLVGDVSYGKAVDVWSIGCMFAEIATGLPLFPGDSDIDQLYQIIRCIGRITPRHQEIFRKNTLYVGVKLPHVTELEPLETRFVSMDKQWIDFMIQTIKDEPLDRWTCGELLEHPLFQDKALYEEELQQAIAKDLEEATQIKKKRNRKLAPGVGPGPGPGFGPTSPTILAAKNGHGQSTPLVRSCESIDYSTPVIVPVVPMSIHEINTGLKKSFKPLGGGLGGGRGGHTSVTKEKMTTKISSKGFSTNTSSLTNGSTLTPLGVVGGFHLPTIQAAANSVLTTLEPLVLTDSIPIHQAKKHHPMPIHEEMGCAPSPFGGATSSQEAFRISMTSHGSRASQPSRHLIPSPFQSNAMQLHQVVVQR